MSTSALIVLLLVATLSNDALGKGDDLADSAVLIAKKSFESSTVFAVGQPIQVTITLFNVGASAATNINIQDVWMADAFDVTSGSLFGKYPTLAPGDRLEHKLVVTPRKPMKFEVPAAVVSFVPKLGFAQDTVQSNTPKGRINIYSIESFDKLSAGNLMEYAAFGVAAGLVVLMPLGAVVYDYFVFTHGVPNTILASVSVKSKAL